MDKLGCFDLCGQPDRGNCERMAALGCHSCNLLSTEGPSLLARGPNNSEMASHDEGKDLCVVEE